MAKMKHDTRMELVGNSTARILLHIGDLNADKKICIITNFWRDLDISFAHAQKVVKMLERDGFVTSKKYGRVRSIKLTERGQFLYEYLWSIRKVFE